MMRCKFWKNSIRFCLAIALLLYGANTSTAFSEYALLLDEQQQLVKKINITGNRSITQSAIRYYLGIAEGDKVDNLILNRSMKAIRAMPAIKQLTFAFTDGVLNVEVKENPIINRIRLVDFGNNAQIVRESLSIKEGEHFNASDMRIAVKEVLYSHNTMGFYLVNVEVDLEKVEDNKVNLSMKLQKGKRAEIDKIIFSGVNAFPHVELKRKVLSTEKKPLSWIFGATSFYREDVSFYDEYNIRKFYQDSGYPFAEVSSMFSEYDVRNNSIILTFNVNEGEKHLLGKSSIEIEDEKLAKQIESNLVLRSGTVYSKRKIDQVKANLEESLANLGFIHATITTDETPRKVDNIVDVVYKINTKGAKSRITQIKISGNVRLNETYIRSVLPVHEGDLLTRKSYNRINRRLGKLQSKGYLKSFSIVIGSEADGHGSIVNITVEEARSINVSFGGSVDGSGIKGNFGIKALALFGGGTDISGSFNTNQNFDTVSLSAGIINETLVRNSYLGFNLNYQRGELNKLYPTLFRGTKPTKNTGNDLSFTGTFGVYDGDITHNLKLAVGFRGSLLDTDVDFKEAVYGFGGAEKFDTTVSYSINYSKSIYYDLIYFNASLNGALSLSLRDDLPEDIINKESKNLTDRELLDLKNRNKGLDFKIGGTIGMTLVLSEQVYIKSSFEGGIISPILCPLSSTGLCSVSQNQRYTLGDASFPGFSKNGIGPRRVGWSKHNLESKNKEAVFGYGGNSYYIFKNSIHFPLVQPIGLRSSIFVVIGAVHASDIHAKNTVVSDSAYPDEMPRLSAGISLEWNSPFGYLVFNFAKALVKGPNDYPYFFSFKIGK